ncbi:MAG: class I SAM-dependent methyltransferase [Terrimicrobiaceae bacterium]
MSLRFLKAFLTSPSTVGAVWPSSPALARQMVATAGLDNASTVVELGPGTGAFTRHIVENLRPGARFAAVEKHPAFAEKISREFPGIQVVSGCATRLSDHLAAENIPAPEAILSGLPWAAFGPELQTAILTQIHGSLAADGVFLTFAYYGPHRFAAGRRFRANLGNLFGDVRRSPVVLRNFPPAFVYSCRR